MNDIRDQLLRIKELSDRLNVMADQAGEAVALSERTITAAEIAISAADLRPIRVAQDPAQK